ncbi:zinc finger protein [Biomphalaria pfeifferi]|uniref:Zinc finger protein n=1 Tax=Biomphalaria pfeifferi TaxID=112525 RepID=A0AAD8C5D9_BIOPF|nr:zinc finger protein [Biomphalaria pfeifferi]
MDSSESRPASPASIQSSLNGLPHMPMEHFDDRTENIEVYLVRFEEVARFYGLPEEKWSSGYPNASEAKPTKCTPNFPPASKKTTQPSNRRFSSSSS